MQIGHGLSFPHRWGAGGFGSEGRPRVHRGGWTRLAFVEVSVVDARGVIVPQANNTIDFAIDGPGSIVGLDNGNTIGHESYKGMSRSAFRGKALAILQSTKAAGKVTLKDTSGSLTGSSVAITTKTP